MKIRYHNIVHDTKQLVVKDTSLPWGLITDNDFYIVARI